MPGHREWAESIAKEEGIQDLITWLNCANEEELRQEYQKSRCCVIPYTDYPGCFPVTMAMANSTPVIVSDAMGLPEYVKDGGGLTVQSRSVHDLAEALQKIQTDNNLHKQLSCQCRDIAEKNFAWDVVSRNLHNVYSSIAN
jgi:glycosyltransferase involved in cell wall biosynthesis